MLGSSPAEEILGSSPAEEIYFIISQKRKLYFKSNNNCKLKENMCTSLNRNFWSAAYFIKIILNKASLVFTCIVFLVDSLNDFV